MSMSMHVVGFRAPDQKWRQMRAIYDSCKSAGVEVPPEVDRFFGGEEPDERGVVVPEKDLPLDAVSEWQDDMREGFEVELAKLPPNITHVRFYCSW